MDAEPTPKLEGYVEELTGRKLSGWVWEAGSNRTLTVEVLFDGRVVGEAVANRFRKDLLDNGKGNGKHAFEFTYPAPATGYQKPGAIQVRVTGTQRELPWIDLLTRRLKDEAAAGARPPLGSKIAAAPVGPPSDNAAPAGSDRAAEPGPAGAASGPEQPAFRHAIVVTGSGGGERARWLGTLCRAAGYEPAIVTLAAGGAAADGDAGDHQIDATQLAALVQQAAVLARARPCDAVIVSPPAIGPLIVGHAIRRLQQCKLLVDHDATESASATLDAERLEQLLRRHEAGEAPLDDPAWTTIARALIAEADGVIAADIAARRACGGMIVRQGCAPDRFDPAGRDRAVVRAAAGLGETDRVMLVFAAEAPGTDLAEIAETLNALDDPGLALCVAGEVTDPACGERLANCATTRVLRRADTAGADIWALADCVALLAPAADTLPARLVEALAMDVPVIARPCVAWADLVAIGAVRTIERGAERATIAAALATGTLGAAQRDGGRAVYDGEFSIAVNAARLALALNRSTVCPAVSQPRWQMLLRLLRRTTGAKLPEAGAPADKSAPDLIVCAAGNEFDIQSGRADRIARALLAMGRVRRVIQFDQPISAARLEAMAAGSGGDPHRGSLIYASTVRRVLELADSPDFLRRTYLHRSGRKP